MDPSPWVSFACPLPEELNARTHLCDKFPDLRHRDDFLEEPMGLYSKVLQSETAAKDRKSDLIRSRLVGYFILYAPTLQALEATVNELRSLQHDASKPFNSACYQLGDELLEKFVRPFRDRRCSECVCHYEDTTNLSVAKAVERAPQHAVIARLTALLRDCFRCEVTGAFDRDSVLGNPRVRTYYDNECPNELLWSTNAHHIIPDFDCLHPGLQGRIDETTEYSEAQWKFWERFGHPELRAELAGKIHRLENIITLRSDICEMADDLRLCLKPVHGKNRTYDIVIFGPNPEFYMRVYDCPAQKIHVINTSADIPIPNMKYLDISATCCFIANLSGAIEYKDKSRIISHRIVMDDPSRLSPGHA
ncbi:hypothetical protein L226DRAFT_614476 [Lentinus tigrinus ALCF2SS1-7]|uniref:HNH nuclease domain-containing protein n=1 Tax=Lentinus tigrinus ALCF2SS1-6 TaxID=1328759 RepID=A0A5C2S436_9APHY|nr:hypothetical protein L227DRAFT_654974 [Lentinus tigrinus ALCF2SS1-6]RPD72900.1 hypothetical protein L226DRAFT_614476 [Lentinus tigrinus ALCF2SS1-7]